MPYFILIIMNTSTHSIPYHRIYRGGGGPAGGRQAQRHPGPVQADGGQLQGQYDMI